MAEPDCASIDDYRRSRLRIAPCALTKNAAGSTQVEPFAQKDFVLDVIRYVYAGTLTNPISSTPAI